MDQDPLPVGPLPLALALGLVEPVPAPALEALRAQLTEALLRLRVEPGGADRFTTEVVLRVIPRPADHDLPDRELPDHAVSDVPPPGETLPREVAVPEGAVRRLGRSFSVAANDALGMVQAIEDAGACFVVGVQWHPEFLVLSPAQQRLFRAFVAASRAHRAETRADPDPLGRKSVRAAA